MTRPVIVKPAAVAEMLQAHDWYEQREAGLGDEFLRCVDACIALLQRNPEAYPVVHKQVRMALNRKNSTKCTMSVAISKIVLLVQQPIFTSGVCFAAGICDRRRSRKPSGQVPSTARFNKQ
jgi:hypothetical protein